MKGSDLMSVRIVTDSTADLPKGLIDELDITVVPLRVHFGDEEYLDWIELDSDTFYEKLTKTAIMPRTSQPSPADFEAVYRQLGGNGDRIISIHLSSHLSGTYQSATIARTMLDGQEIEVVDSKVASMALGIIVIEAARLAKQGKTKEEIMVHVYEATNKVKIYFGVDTLEYLQKNGRIGKAAAMLGGLLNVKPLLTLKDGIVTPKGKVRGRAKLVERLLELVGEELQDTKKGKIAIIHGNALEDALKIKEKIDEKFAFSEIIISPLGAVIGTHTGPGVLGTAILPE
jgi:DegV family protein with EDD domain